MRCDDLEISYRVCTRLAVSSTNLIGVRNRRLFFLSFYTLFIRSLMFPVKLTFSLLPLNVRGIQNKVKRKAMFLFCKSRFFLVFFTIKHILLVMMLHFVRVSGEIKPCY